MSTFLDQMLNKNQVTSPRGLRRNAIVLEPTLSAKDDKPKVHNKVIGQKIHKNRKKVPLFLRP